MVVPQAAAVRGNVTPQLGNSPRSLPPGFSVQIVPLRYVGVREMLRILEPFARDAHGRAHRRAPQHADPVRHGARAAPPAWTPIDMFDIDWMAGMSAGVFTLQNSDVKSVMTELEKIVGDRTTSPITGILSIVPIERMNAMLVVTPQPAVPRRGQEVDRPPRQLGGGEGVRFYVYHLQNTRAERLGPLLQQAFTGRASQRRGRRRRPRSPRARRRARSSIRRPSRRSRRFRVANPAASRPQPVAAGAAAGAGRPRGDHRRRCRHRAQRPGRRRQGPEHDPDRRHAGRVLDHRAGAAQARRAVTPGDDGGDGRRSEPHRHDPVRRRLAVQGRRAERAGARAACSCRTSRSTRPCPSPRRRRARSPRGSRPPPRASATSSTTPTSRAASRRC